MHLGYNVIQLDQFASYGQKVGQSNAEAMLTHWGTKNHTVVELFILLRQMGHLQAMEALRSVT
jgi:hypothetical protein